MSPRAVKGLTGNFMWLASVQWRIEVWMGGRSDGPSRRRLTQAQIDGFVSPMLMGEYCPVSF